MKSRKFFLYLTGIVGEKPKFSAFCAVWACLFYKVFLLLLLNCLPVQGFDNVEVFQYVATDEPIMMPKPDERQARTAAKRSGLVKAPPQQAAFAAQNLEDMLIYDADRYLHTIGFGVVNPDPYWIRIGSVFWSFVDPDPAYGSM